MKYSPKLYATAFSELASGPLKPAEEKNLIANLLRTVEKNGDRSGLQKILAETDRLLRAKSGRRKVVLETARALDPKSLTELQHLFQKKDIVETRLNTDLVAGVKVTVDGERQFDGSLRRKLDKLFR